MSWASCSGTLGVGPRLIGWAICGVCKEEVPMFEDSGGLLPAHELPGPGQPGGCVAPTIFELGAAGITPCPGSGKPPLKWIKDYRKEDNEWPITT